VGVRPRTDRHTDRHTDARDHNTFCVVYDSRKMQLFINAIKHLVLEHSVYL